MENKQLELMDKIAEVGEKNGIVNEFTANNGVVLRLIRVKSSIVRKSWQFLEKPKVPRVFWEEKERWEENPNDPDYKQAFMEYEGERAETIANTYYMLGSSAKFVPEGVHGVDNVEWEEILDVINEKVPSKPMVRYLYWLKYYVLDDDDTPELLKAIMRFSGVTLSSDVVEAEESFRNT